MKNFIKTNLIKFVVSSILILFPAVIWLIKWNGTSSELEFWGDGPFIALPLILLALHWLCLTFTAMDKGNANQNPKVMNIVFWVLPIISIYVNLLGYLIVFGKEFNPLLVTTIIIGLGFILIGNYLPKSKQNRTFGIKIKYTLANEENWYATHRFGGKIWVFGGLIIIFLSLLPPKIAFIALFPIILVMCLIPTIYSHVYFKKQLKDGRATTNELKNIWGEKTKEFTIIGIIFSVIILAFCALIMFTGNISYNFAEDSFTVEADYFKDLTVNYSEITNIELRENNNAGSRVFGFGSARLLMGTFRNAEFHNYTRYSYTSCDSCVVLTVNERIIILNATDDNGTTELYNTLIKKCD